MTAIVFLPPAEEEMTAAAQYYQTQSMGLGEAVTMCMERPPSSVMVVPDFPCPEPIRAIPTLSKYLPHYKLRT
jgi:hypothetical protein